MTASEPRIGVAVSGGGFRATAFGLGCLRALHDTGLLPSVTVISGISGGSLLTALYAYGPRDFGAFDRDAVELMRDGLQAALIRRALSPPALTRNLVSACRALIPERTGREPRPRTANRTDALRDELAHRLFADHTLDQVTHPALDVVLTATDLRTSNAVRFGSRCSSISPYGVITEPVTIAEAVAASAAFPLLLPTMERRFTLVPAAGSLAVPRTLLLSDGGIYDNLGLSVLEPGRSASHTSHVYEVDYIIACDAGRGRLPLAAGHFAGSRLRRSFDTVHRRAQDAARNKLHETAAAGRLSGFVHAYLGTQDEHLPVPVPDLVPWSSVHDYPTNFRAMAPADLERITIRAEQLTRALLAHYCPQLV